MTVNDTVSDQPPEREPGYDERHFTARHAEMFGVVDETVIAPPEPVVHYDLDNVDLLTGCGLELGQLGRDTYSTDPAAVDCPPCAATLVDGQLSEPGHCPRCDSPDPAKHPAVQFEGEVSICPDAFHSPAPERTDWAHMSDDELEDRLRGSLKAAAEHEGFADLAPPVGPAPAVARTVSIEPLTAELRAAADAAIVADFNAFPREPGQEPELLPPESRTAVVVRVAGVLETVTDVETDVPQRDAVGALAWMLGQAVGRARNLDAELLMPGADVLAALSGQPVGRYTAPIQLRADQVDVGWLVLNFSSEGAQERVKAVLDCEDDTCTWMDCHVIVAEGVEPVHFASYHGVTVRIPATTEVAQ